MNIFPRAKYYLKVYLNHLSNSQIINKIDHDKDYIASVQKKIKEDDNLKKLDKHGFLYFDNYLPNDLQKLIKSNFEEKKNYFSENMIQVFDFIEKNFYGVINDYLNGEAVMSAYNISKIEKTIDSVSGSWHTDDLGRKINLFLCVKGDGSMPTAYLPGTHKKKYFPNILVNLRHAQINNFNKKKDEHFLSYKDKDCVLFDANGLHRGVYEKDGTSDRIVYQMQFVNIKKIYELGFKKTPKLFVYKNSKPIFREQPVNDMYEIDEKLVDKFLKFKFLRKEFIQQKDKKNFYYLK